MDSKEVWKRSYWINDAALSQLIEQMQKQNTPVVRAEKNPCEALLGQIGYAEPHTWSVICRHDAAPWYEQSSHAGKNLVASSFPLGGTWEQYCETTITPVSFSPPALPDQAQQKALTEDDRYRQTEPEGWGGFPEEMRQAMIAGLKKRYGGTPDNFEELLRTWTAVHANFITGSFSADDQWCSAPYSIADSTCISSCCVELFNLLDSDKKALLVKPCIGAVIVGVLEQDTYYLVKILKNN